MSERSRVPRAVTVAVAAVAAAISIWAVVTSALFHIQEIEVRGNRRLSDVEIVRRSGVRLGSNILTLPLQEVEESLLTSPWIGAADAVRSLPSTLVLRVRERAPVAWVRDPDGYTVLSADGTVVEKRTDTPQGLVALGTSAVSVPVGTQTSGIRAPLRVAGSLPPRLRRTVEEARAVGNEVELMLDGGAKIYYGEANLLEAKNAAVDSMLRYARKEGIEIAYIDVRSPTAPALKPVEAL